MLTVEALLETDHRLPNLDYRDIMKLTKILTGNDRDQLIQQYRRMCFNVFARNRDDHSKNFTFLYDETADRWLLSPAYDLTYSSTYFGEHTTSVAGNAADPGPGDLLAVGTDAGLPEKLCRSIAGEIREKCGRLMEALGL